MNWHDATRTVVWTGFGLFAAAFVLLGIWDLVLIIKNKLPGNSASGVILDIARTVPWFVFLIAFVLGVLVGHFLWPQVVRLITPPAA